MKAVLEISHASSKTVEVGLWYGSTLDLPVKLLEQLYDYYHLLKNFVIFTPHVMTIQGSSSVQDG